MIKRRETGPQIQAHELTKRYMGSEAVFSALSLNIQPGQLTLITGPSGSGKTTLLNIISGLDTPDEGAVWVDGVDITKLSKAERTQYRAASGLIFQRSGLLAGLTARENIDAIRTLSGYETDEGWTLELARKFRVDHVLGQKAAHLSGGQAQRVAMIRALAHDPGLVFADEPTASLDSESRHEVYDALRTTADRGATVVMASHDETSKHYANRVVEMRDGKIVNRGGTYHGRAAV